MKTTLPDLLEALHSLEKSGNQGQPAARTDLHFVVSEAKRIAGTINAMSQLLSVSDESGRASLRKIVQ